MGTQKPTELPPKINLDRAEPGNPLVNENDLIELKTQIGVLEEQLKKKSSDYTSAVQTLNNVKGKLREAEEKIAKAGYAPDARKFRLFLELAHGFTARGAFDQDTLAKKGMGAEMQIVSTFNHIAGLTEVGFKAIEKRF